MTKTENPKGDGKKRVTPPKSFPGQPGRAESHKGNKVQPAKQRIRLQKGR